MKYLLDGRPLQGPSAVRGIGTYASSLLSEYAALGIAGEVGVLLSAGARVPGEVRDARVEVAATRLAVTHPTLQPLVDPLLVARAVRRLRPALYHGIELAQPLISSAAVVITVHDLIPFVLPDDYPWVRRARVPAIRLLRRADRIIAPSQSTVTDLQRIARVHAAKIDVVAYGVSQLFHRAPAVVIGAVRERYELERPYVLAVGTFDPRKRIDVLAEVVARIRAARDVDLVIAGDQGTFAQTVQRALERAGVAPNTRVLGHVPLDELVALFSGAECLLFTSAYEGFGLPPLEAMACGTVAAMFDNSSLPEVAGPAALLIRDGDTRGMADAVAKLIADPADAERRRQAGAAWASRFTWRRCAEATIAVYERALRGR